MPVSTQTETSPAATVTPAAGALARTGFLLSRALFAAVTLGASCYFVLAAFTQAYFGIGPLELTDAVRDVVGAFPFVYWIAVLSVAATLCPALRTEYRRLAAGWIALAVVAGVALHVWGLKTAPGDERSMTWSMIATFPAAWLGLLDTLLARRLAPRNERSMPPQPGVHISATLIAVFAVAAVFGIRAATLTASALDVSASQLLPMTLLGTVFVAALSLVALTGITLLQLVAARWSSTGPFIVSAIAWWILAALATRRIVAPAISFTNAYADLWSALLPAGPILLLAGATIRARAMADQAPATDALALFRPIRLPRHFAWITSAIIIALAVLAAAAVAPLDWQSMFQHLIALIAMIAVLVLVNREQPGRTHKTRMLAIVTVVAFACVVALIDFPRAVKRVLGAQPASTAALFLSFEPLTEATQQLIRTPFRDAAADEFFAFLRANSMITQPIRAPKIEIAPRTKPLANKPDIYIIMVDSLRRDFVGAYSPQADTPAMTAFANESAVFENAFTRYAGTVLSEPALWTGITLIQHEYPKPFADLNTLERLVAEEGYVRMLARDPVVDPLWQRLPGDIEIGKGVKYWTDLTADVALGQIAKELASIPPTQPVFAFVQPQDIHGVSLSLRRSAHPDFKSKPFVEQYRIGISEIDRALGKFIDSLKQSGRYENSIIVLTSDHGEGVGDFGRWGHSDSVLPEVIRVRLIIHLPASMRGMHPDLRTTCVLTDVTPSLYYLLGRRPVIKHPVVGRPLFTETPEEQRKYAREFEVIGNSYGPRFAVIDREARTMFLADAVRRREAFFDLQRDPHALRNMITVEEQQRGERRVREFLDDVNRFYNYTPKVR